MQLALCGRWWLVFAPSQIGCETGLAVAQSVQESLVLPLLTGAGLEEVVMLSDLLQVAAGRSRRRNWLLRLRHQWCARRWHSLVCPTSFCRLPAIHQGMTRPPLGFGGDDGCCAMVSLPGRPGEEIEGQSWDFGGSRRKDLLF